MKNWMVSLALAPLLPLCLLAAREVVADEGCEQAPVAITSVRVFDGEAVIPEATVLIRCTTISRLMTGSEPTELPQDAILIDGKGRTLLPGLIDTHTHTYSPAMLKRPLDFGVTTVMDMGSTNREFARSIRAEDRQSPAQDRADLLSAVLWVTAPGSHGTQFGEVPTLDNPDAASAFVAARIEEGADYIKIIYDNFKMFDRPIPTLSRETLFAVVEAAHAQGRIAVAHSRDVQAYADVIRAGADGIVHTPVDEVPDSKLISLLKEQGMFVSANLSLLRPVGSSLIDDPALGPLLTDSEKDNLREFYAMHREGGDQVSFDTVNALHQAGVTILAGSDTPNGGTAIGASLHLELELLVEAGLTPTEAIRAATSSAADAFGLIDRGRVAEGLKADLLLVEGRPDTRIRDTRNIVTVWKAGKAHPR